MYRFRKYLERIGHQVQVVCPTPASAAFQESAGVYRVPAQLPNQSPKSWKLYLDLSLARAMFRDMGALWVPGAIRQAAQLISGAIPPVVISTSPPIHPHFAALRLKQRFGIPWIADFRDPLTGNAGRQQKHTRYFDRFYESAFVRNADVIVVNTDNAAAYWRELYPESASKIRVIWNGFDPDDFDELPAPPPRSFTLLSHVGHVYGDRDPGRLLSGFDQLIQKGRLDPKSFRLEFHGSLPAHTTKDPVFQRLRSAGCVSHEVAAPTKDQSENVMRSSDVLVLIDFMEPARLQVPAKVFFYLRTGRTVLAYTLTGSSAEQIFKQSGIPFVCLHPTDSDEQIEHGILRTLATPKGTYTPNEWFASNFDARRQSETLSELICELFDVRGSQRPS